MSNIPPPFPPNVPPRGVQLPPAYPEFFNPNVDASGVVQADSPCRKCGYNLRGLSIHGRCPECGTPVGLSIQGDLLRFSDPQWVRKLKRGCNLILIGIGLIVLGVIVTIAMSAGGATSGGEYIQILMIAASILMLIGAWMLTEPDPSGLGEDKYGTSRKIIRFALIVGVISNVIEYVPRTTSVSPDVRKMLQVLAGLAGLVSLVGQFAQLNYLSKLALRIPDQKLADRARTIMWGIGVSYGLILVGGIMIVIVGSTRTAGQPGGAVMMLGCGMAIVGLCLVVFGIMYLLLLEKLGRRFGEQAELAEQSWARATA